MTAIPKKVREEDPDYLKWIKWHACLLLARDTCLGPIDPHHVTPVSLGGSDRETLPLCRLHHDLANRREWFENLYKIDFDAEIGRLNGIYERTHRP